ncbi:MAG: Transcriptional regulator, MarR family protein [Frondihabitans sp.]|nr:Transcriptional regulator, MarR family protein [Frondihabitans sp.]
MTTAEDARPNSSIAEDALVDAIVEASFATMAVLTKVGAEHELSLTQLRVLGILRDRRLRMSTLADYLGLEKSSLTGLVDRAAKRGLLERAPSESDGRAVDVFLSSDGVDIAEALYAQVRQALAPLTTRLTASERPRLEVLLRRLLGPTSL